MNDAALTGITGIENKLRRLLDAVRAGRDDRLEAHLAELGDAIAALESAAASDVAPEDLARIRDLWKQAALALASATQNARGELQRVTAGRKTLKAYKP